MSTLFKAGDRIRVHTPNNLRWHNKVGTFQYYEESKGYCKVSIDGDSTVYSAALRVIVYLVPRSITERIEDKIKYLDTKKYKCKTQSVFKKELSHV
jgi:hypothetical protein